MLGKDPWRQVTYPRALWEITITRYSILTAVSFKWTGIREIRTNGLDFGACGEMVAGLNLMKDFGECGRISQSEESWEKVTELTPADDEG